MLGRKIIPEKSMKMVVFKWHNFRTPYKYLWKMHIILENWFWQNIP